MGTIFFGKSSETFFSGPLKVEIKGVFFWYLLFSAGCLLFLVGFKILFIWYCLPKTVGLEGLSNLLLLELEGFADFERILVRIGRPILLGMENFTCEVYWFQNSAVVY